jgi:hypothetical protein
MLYPIINPSENFIPHDNDDMVYAAGLKAMGIRSMILPISFEGKVMKNSDSGYVHSVSDAKAFEITSTTLIDGCREKAVSVRYWQVVSITETENGISFNVEKEVIK